MVQPTRFSYIFIFATLAVAAWLHLATPLLTILFAYFALTKLNRFRYRWIAAVLFVILVLGIFYAFGWFIRQAVVALPKIAATAIPSMLDYAKAHGFDLPFEDLDILLEVVI